MLADSTEQATDLQEKIQKIDADVMQKTIESVPGWEDVVFEGTTVSVVEVEAEVFFKSTPPPTSTPYSEGQNSGLHPAIFAAIAVAVLLFLIVMAARLKSLRRKTAFEAMEEGQISSNAKLDENTPNDETDEVCIFSIVPVCV